MSSRGRMLFALLLGVVLTLVGAFTLDAVSSAQDACYPLCTPSPTPTATATPTATPSGTPVATPKTTKTPKPTKTPNPHHPCVNTGSQNGQSFKPKTTFKPGEQIIIHSATHCAKPNAKATGTLDPAGSKHTIGSANAGSGGSYVIKGHIPGSTGPGTHVVQVTTSGKRYSAPITVTSRTARSAAGFLTSPTGLVGLGIIIIVLALLVLLSPRRPRLLQLTSAAGTGGTTSVPTIDTSGFVPTVKKQPRKRSPRKQPPAE